ncbi:unnamed protein product [Enterobius vermicularis]|uniref:Kinesin motor domain-containing protein n=1 Tax=Enterobius vermicularis TaxID=51028 RepID=A0A158QAD7_ENTVE|nr:unnamed protein product [Enterobius vermicularis]
MPYAKSADRYSGRYPVSACSSGSGGGTVSGNSGGISGSPNHALPGASVRTMEKVEEIALPPSLQRFITAPATTRLQQTQLKTVLRLTKEDMENVSANGNTLTFRNCQSTAKNLVKYNFDHLFSPDVTQQQICSVCLPDLLQSCFNGLDACFLYFGASKGWFYFQFSFATNFFKFRSFVLLP